ncbi:MAG TPA: FliM/FliN family flagellar motor switch protein [Anaeromyxobacteraceae bacterium]|nr:FliM/FliN family flagellar motor switch protein [Anaeromyxobacteraceae bacterium]
MPLPFELPSVSRGFALLSPGAREIGLRAAGEVSRALATLTGGAVSLSAEPRPGVPAPGAAMSRLRVELAALPGTATLEVEAALAVALLDRLCGGPGLPAPATSATPLERAAVELATLSALAAVTSLPEVESRLAPRLSRQAGEPLGGLAIDLSIALGEGAQAGRARLVLPHAAVRALDTGAPEGAPACALPLELSLRGGAAPLEREELAALAPGDVVLLDPPAPGRLTAVAPGGLRLVGAESEDGLLVEEIQMPESSSAAAWPIAVEVELARVPITLGELARLSPGGVLPLPIDRRGLVALKVGERTIAHGQLVDVEGGLGVRIDSLVEGP